MPPEINDSEIYWIHPDHLGSSSVFTNSNGEISNWYEYMPFGEPLMELTTGQYNNPYKYNGKETDSQTGLHYYGARYYDSQRSFWLSVDPLVEETMSPYLYTYNNPINFVDPDGNRPILPSNFIMKIIYGTNRNFLQAIMFSNNNSPRLFYNWASKKDKGDHWNTFAGTAGESLAADYLIQSFSKAKASNPLIGDVEYGNYIGKNQVDVQMNFWTGKARTVGLKAKSEVSLHYHDFKGGLYYTQYDSKIPVKWTINYEVKTFGASRKGGAKSLYSSYKSAFEQVDNLTSTAKSNVGVLVTDYDAWMTVANDKVYGPRLRSLYNTYVDETNDDGVKLLLIKNLTKDAGKVVNQMYDAVKNK